MRLRDRSRVFKPKPKSCVTSPMTNTGRKDRVRDRKRRWPLSIFDMSEEIVCRTSRVASDMHKPLLDRDCAIFCRFSGRTGFKHSITKAHPLTAKLSSCKPFWSGFKIGI